MLKQRNTRLSAMLDEFAVYWLIVSIGHLAWGGSNPGFFATIVAGLILSDAIVPEPPSRTKKKVD